jgi:hypothetical protein
VTEFAYTAFAVFLGVLAAIEVHRARIIRASLVRDLKRWETVFGLTPGRFDSFAKRERRVRDAAQRLSAPPARVAN